MHRHHKIPRHAGGTDEPSNIIECSVEEHAELHFALYLEHGRWQDWYAAMGLAGIIGKEEIVREQCSRASIKGNTGRKRPDFAKWLKENPDRPMAPAGWNKGVPRTEEEKKKMSAGQKKLYENGYINPNKGVPRTEEQKKRQSEVMKGKPAWNKGVERTEEEKRKVSEGHKKLYENGYTNPFTGKKHSDETKAKMKAYWAKRREEKLNTLDK